MHRVGIIIPVFGHSRFVRDAIASAMGQTGVKAEVLVVCDGCTRRDTQTVRDIVEAMNNKNVHFAYKENGGLSSARNFGIEWFVKNLQIEYIYFLDADNIIESGAINCGIVDLERGSADWAYPDILSLGSSQASTVTSGEFNPFVLVARNYIEAGSLVSRRLFDDGMRFDETLTLGYEDWDFWLEAVKRGFRGVHSGGLALNYRQRFESMLSDADRSRDKIVSQLRNKHEALYTPKALRGFEDQYSPRYCVVDVVGLTCSMNSLKFGTKLEELYLKLNRVDIPVGLNNGPDFIAFLDPVALEGCGGLDWCDSALHISEQVLEKGSEICVLRLVRGKKVGLSIGETDDGTGVVVGVVVSRKLLLEILRDNNDWAVSQLTLQSGAVASAINIHVLEGPTIKSGFVRDFERCLDVLRTRIMSGKGMLEGYQQSSVTFAMVSAASSYEIRNELPVYPSPFSPQILPNTRNVGFVLPFGSFGGVERVTIEVAEELSRRGVKCHCFIELAVPIQSDFLASTAFASITYLTPRGGLDWDHSKTYLGTPVASASEADIRWMEGVLGEMDEVVFCNAHLAIQCAARLKKKGIRTSAYVHTFDHTAMGERTGWPFYVMGFEHKLARIYTCSPTMTEDMLALGSPKDILTTITNASRVPAVLRQASPSALSGLGYVGRLDRQKGLDRLIGIADLVDADLEHFQLKIAGEAILSSDQTFDRLKSFFVGALDRTELTDFLDGIDFLLLPSYWEGLPLVVLEALSRGVICICAPVGDLPRLAEECSAVILADWDNPNGVMDVLRACKSSMTILHKAAFEYSMLNNWKTNIPEHAFI